MRKFITSFIIISALLGCQSCNKDNHTEKPAVQMVVIDESLDQFSVLWQKEISRRFPDAVVIFCHGASFLEGEWVVKAPFGDRDSMKTADLANYYKTIYPNRIIVLLACNPGHLKLGVSGVYYSPSSVWCTPDRSVISHSLSKYMRIDGSHAAAKDEDEETPVKIDRSEFDPDSVGSIFEFINE